MTDDDHFQLLLVGAITNLSAALLILAQQYEQDDGPPDPGEEIPEEQERVVVNLRGGKGK